MTERPILMNIASRKGKPRIGGLTWKQRNRDAVNERRRVLYAADTKKHRARASDYRRRQRDAVNKYNAVWGSKYRVRLRTEMIQAYGGRCCCCGERERAFLQLDHINNDGALERRTTRGGTPMLAKIKKLGWPKDRDQLLCANCNFGRHINGGICPHNAHA